MRLDKALLQRGLTTSRSRAQALIADGSVTVDGVVVRKASSNVGDGQTLEIAVDSMVWVSRAALKLVHGLEVFGIDCADKIVLDVGASTGGFTQVALEGGAAHVYALDVGHGQLQETLRDDPRVTNMEGTNARYLEPNALPLLDLIVSDVSFISLEKALPVPLSFAKTGAHLVALIKPQFEVGRGNIGKGGIVKDASKRDAARENIRAFLVAEGWEIIGEAESPITGSDGNVEYLIGARRI